MNKALKILSLVLFGSLITANTLNIEPDGNGDWNVNYTSNEDMGGFQFNVQGGSLNDAFGGDAEANGFMISTGGSMVLGFSLTGSTIPAGEGTLVILEVSGTPTELYDIVISDSDGIALDFTFIPGGAPGCTDDSACNYNEGATVDDGSCSYPDEGFNCDGNPIDFTFNQSTLQAAYFFVEVTLNGNPIEADDWVGVFNGNICVGTMQWDTSQCGGGVCSINVMGNDGSEYTLGYCNTGDLPSFKIYDTSTNLYYNAYPTEEAVWVNNGFNFIDGLSNGESGCTDPDACNYNPDAIEDDESCEFAEENYDCDGNCTAGEDCNGDCGGSAVEDECGVCGGDGSDDLGCGCFEEGPSGCDETCGSTLENDECGVCGGDGANIACWDGSYACEANDCPDELDECMDDPNICIWNSVYNNYDNQEDCEANGGIWGGYLEYFNTSCEEMVNLENGCDIQILYWTISALCPASCGVCCDDEDACNHDGEGSCEYAEENYDCDGTCTAGEDCNGDCGGSAVEDECSVCGGTGIPDGECDCNGNVDLGCGCGAAGPSGCNNACGSTLENDECGVCGGDNTSCADCAGIPNGDNLEDNCGTCDNDPSNDCIQDCAGEWGGAAYEDGCGVCDIDPSNDNADDLGCECFEPGPSGCDNECGSTLENDECGVCGGDGSSCVFPDEFQYNSSTLQAFYYFNSVTINDIAVEPDDWVGAFRDTNGDGEGEICVGSRRWDISLCGGGVCDVPVMGDDGNDFTEGYMQNGDIPIFKIYDASENEFYDANASEDIGWSNFSFNNIETLTASQVEFGCMDESACNYNPNATEDNGSCEFAEENFDCDGNCIVYLDCAGVCGGSAVVDECDVCGGDGPLEGYTCDGIPELFTFNQSTQQAFYYFYAVTLNGDNVEADDWVGAFNGDICVGARRWDASLCNSGVCDVPVMGDEGNDFTEGYMQNGDIPTFKIYDASEDTYYDAIPSEEFPWENFGFNFADNLNGFILGCTNMSACNYNADATLDDGSCELPQGCNVWCSGDEGEPQELDCAGECGGSAVVDECEVCNGDGPLEGYTCDGIPELFTFNQSTQQAFYYFYAVTLNGDNVESDDWVGAFNGDICVGARRWDASLCNSGVCDVPVMGDEGNDFTEGYMQSGDIPTFKVFNAANNEYFDALASEDIAWENNNLALLNSLQGGILGCTDESACNADESATVEDGSCTYPEENYDCDGNCLVDIDCEDVCGGMAIEDECGICEGTGPEEGFSCDGTPIDFVYNQSSIQAFYYIYETSDLTGDPLTAEDWVGVFNGETCVGSRQWDTSQCNSDICDVPAMGNDGNEYSDGYLNEGDMPGFKIYDASEGEYFDVYPYPENYAFEVNTAFTIDELVFDFSYSIPLHQYNNLISFYVLPEETEVSSVMMDIQDNINLVIGEATSAQYDGEYWTGSLMNLDISSGYWLRLENADTLDGSGHPLNPDRIYNLPSGANLVSFPSPGSVGISEGLPDDIEDHVLAIIGEGVSAQYDGDTWTGSLMDFKGLHGYWIITDSEISFSYDLDTETLSRKSNPYKVAKNPQGFEFVQSPQQAFYFVDNVELLEGEIEKGDWIISYCGNTVTGSRLWLGRTVDIPVMGAEGTPVTAGYCEANDTPNFKLYKSASQELISLHADIPKWQSNGIFQLNALMESAPIPTEYGMGSAYPNPFNPITQIGYEIPAESHIEISVFDLRGQKVATLVNEFTKPGAYSITWDAAKISSGVYFVHFTATGESMAAVSQIQKLMLIK